MKGEADFLKQMSNRHNKLNKSKTKLFALWEINSKSSVEYHRQVNTWMTYIQRKVHKGKT